MKRDYKVGFIGCGNMGSAMIGGILKNGLAGKDEIIASCKSEGTKERITKELGITVTLDSAEVAQKADVVFLAIKPYQFDAVLPQINGKLEADQIVISVAAGKSLSMIETALMSIDVAGKLKVVRAMPNTPALVGEAMTAITPNANLNEEDIAKVKALFESFGQVEVVPESMMNAVIGVSGSSPAFIYMLIEAMADAAVVEGMPRAQAYKFAAQSVLGSAKMVLETGMHPGALKDAVCSPGGTTIAGVEALEQCGFRGTVMEGIRATVAKAEEMSK
ncbi:MAG: pyrroline-5-carboxylate reductase [Lachnospiraceae bacterium]|nr:pyrroline-5-carboxylate reductase [Lachnospiraceae bacterium]MBQ1640691.1 pyrroline-5-carboxylate reductase [Lachnospiraceae bacterium]MBQ2466606.1 pyrroline-5-carboxylate reductase [Lachnospiraceae bacterium]MBQ2504024.1 pyrroline-5-carboxylate reductase [Lachnospiraceae bacterium]MBQ2577803.1 pyrroline-5-carboxylate reductase [Lachnospiraceae bacterium]